MKTYTDEEINSLIDELQKELPEILKAEVALKSEALTKAEGKVIPTAKEGGNGTTPEVRGNNNMSKTSQSFAKAGESEPKAEPADDEGGDSPGGSASPSAPPDASSSPAAASPSASAAPDASASPAGAVDPTAAAADPAASPDAMGGAGGPDQLKQAYSALSDDEFKAHLQALMGAAMDKLGASAMGAGGPMDAGVPAPDPASAAPAGDMTSLAPPPQDASASMAPPPPAQKAQPAPAAPPMMKVAPSPGMVVKSEVNVKEEALAKAEERIQGLEKAFEGVTSLLETMLTKPVQKSVTSMAEFIAKGNSEKPATKLSRTELMKMATEKSKKPDLTKSERDVINKYVLSGEGLADLEKLLKE